ncbi:MAG: hypothetical protein ABIN69_00370 [Aestuariivirga sp.]
MTMKRRLWKLEGKLDPPAMRIILVDDAGAMLPGEYTSKPGIAVYMSRDDMLL